MLWGLETQETLGTAKKNNTWLPQIPLGGFTSFTPSSCSWTRCHIPRPCSFLSCAALLQCPEDVVKGCLPVMGLCKVRLSILMELQKDAGDPEQEGMGKD